MFGSSISLTLEKLILSKIGFYTQMKWYLSRCEKAMLCCNSNTFPPRIYRSHDTLINGNWLPCRTRGSNALHNSWKIEWVILKFWKPKSHEISQTCLLPRIRAFPFQRSSHTTPMLPLISDNDSQCSCCNENKSARICHASWNHWVKMFFRHINVFSVRTCSNCAIVFYWHFEIIAEV